MLLPWCTSWTSIPNFVTSSRGKLVIWPGGENATSLSLSMTSVDTGQEKLMMAFSSMNAIRGTPTHVDEIYGILVSIMVSNDGSNLLSII
jgi:hypothetical protein